MNVAQLLDFKGHDVATISQGRSVSDAVSLMRERGIGARHFDALDSRSTRMPTSDAEIKD